MILPSLPDSLSKIVSHAGGLVGSTSACFCRVLHSSSYMGRYCISLSFFEGRTGWQIICDSRTIMPIAQAIVVITDNSKSFIVLHAYVARLSICERWICVRRCLHPRTESYFSFPFSFKAEYSKTEPSTTYETLQLQLNPTRVGSASSSRIEAGSTKIPLLQHRANATSGRLALLFFGRVGNSFTSAGRARSDLAAPKAAWESIQQHVIAPNLLEVSSRPQPTRVKVRAVLVGFR